MAGKGPAYEDNRKEELGMPIHRGPVPFFGHMVRQKQLNRLLNDA